MTLWLVRTRKSGPQLTIFRSYGAILQSSFGAVLSIVLAYDASPPVSVFSTVKYPPFLAPGKEDKYPSNDLAVLA
jgi:hypothetical protein